MRRRDFFKNSPKLFRSLIEYGRKGSSEERERGGLRNIFGGRSECNLSDLEPLDQVTILHSPGNIAVISDTNCDEYEDDDKISDIPVNSDPSKKNPVRKNTLSSGEVTVIAAPEAVIDDHDERRYVTVTNIFSHPVLDHQDPLQEPQLKLSNSQLLFNIEALKIAKRARDLQNIANTKSRKKIKSNFILNKLRKFKSLPNLSVIKNITMRRVKTRAGE